MSRIGKNAVAIPLAPVGLREAGAQRFDCLADGLLFWRDFEIHGQSDVGLMKRIGQRGAGSEQCGRRGEVGVSPGPEAGQGELIIDPLADQLDHHAELHLSRVAPYQ